MVSPIPQIVRGDTSRASSFALASPAGDVQSYLASKEFQQAIRNAPSATSDAGSVVAHELLSRRAPKSGYRFSTVCATVDDPEHHDQYGSSSVPVYLSATFKGPPGAEFDYSRSGNPTRSMLQHHLSQLQNCRFSFAVSSGMACLDVITRLVKPGERIVAGDDLYGGSNRLLGYLKSHGGIEVDHVDTTDASKVETLLAQRAEDVKNKVPGIGPVKMVLLETPTNPLIKVIDLKRCCKAAKVNFPESIVVVDNTMMSPYLMRPLELGADISYDSGTKYLSGHHDLMAGAISCDREDIGKDIAFTINAVGNALTPLDCFLLLRGIKTLAVRMDRQQAASYRVANYLEGLGFKVNYPGLASHPGKEVHDQQAAGPGAVLSFHTFDDELSKKIVGAARLWSISVSFGCVNSLISMPCLMSHASIPPEVRKARRLPEDLIRLCVGIEDPRDLIDDLQSALLAAGAIRRKDGLPSEPSNEEENELEYVRLYERVPVNTEAETDYLACKVAQAVVPITAAEDSDVPDPSHAGGENVNMLETRGGDDPANRKGLVAVATTNGVGRDRSDPDTTADAIEASVAPGRTSLLDEQDVAADGSVLPKSQAHGVGQDHTSQLPSELVASAPGKVILFGEHAVVHGVPAIAGAVDLRCYVHVARRSDGKVSLKVPDVDASFEWNTKDLPWSSLPETVKQGHVEDGTDLPTHADESLDDTLRQAIEVFVEHTTPFQPDNIKSRQARGSAVAFLYLYMCIAGPISGAQGQALVFRSALPLSAGLGSSAAYSSCLASALIFSHGHLPLPAANAQQELDGTSKAVLNSWAFLAEKILHGTPSGVDNTVAVYGGAVAFTRAHARNGLLRNQIEQLGAHPADGTVAHMKGWRLLLTDTRVPRDTKRLVASVSEQLATEPERVEDILDRIEDITTQASALLSAPPSLKSERALGTLFSANHKALDELKVSHSALEQVRQLTVQAPLKLSTKLTGAGGGGCAITLVPSVAVEDQIQQLEQALANAGFRTHEIEVGGPGVGVYVPPGIATAPTQIGTATWFDTHSGQEVADWAHAQQGWIFA